MFKIFKPKMPHEGHEMHLCYLANLGYQMQDTEDYRQLVRDAKYVCKVCGRAAADKMNLCQPKKL
jgi:hypothetical protein